MKWKEREEREVNNRMRGLQKGSEGSGWQKDEDEREGKERQNKQWRKKREKDSKIFNIALKSEFYTYVEK